MALYSSMASKKTMQLRDGRVLSYCLVGHDLQQQQHIDANSSSSSLAKVPTPTVSPAALQPIKPAATVTPVATVVYHHGWPSSAAEAGVWHTAASELAVQMVAVDRPGIGGSTFDPKGTFASYADDVAELISHLSLPKVIHIGTSGGGPYACACASLQPQTTAALGLVASTTHCVGPESDQLVQGMDWFDRFGAGCVAYAPMPTALTLAVLAPFVYAASTLLVHLVAACNSATCSSRSSTNRGSRGGSSQPSAGFSVSGLLKWATKAVGEAALLVLGATLPKQDRTAMLQHPRVFAALIPTLLSDAFKQGGRGFFADMRLTTLPWDFSLGRIAVPTVVFQGDADVTVTVKMADWLGRHIPGAEVKLYRNEAHFSLIVNHTAEMLKMVLQKAA